jgi:hypothetical protein
MDSDAPLVVPTESNVVCSKSQDISSGMRRLGKMVYQFGIGIALEARR